MRSLLNLPEDYSLLFFKDHLHLFKSKATDSLDEKFG